jgi:Matrixin
MRAKRSCGWLGITLIIVTQSASAAVIGESCASSDPNHLCLALRYVTFRDPNGVPGVSENLAVANVRRVNRVWSACRIGFQIEDYEATNPQDYGLALHIAGYPELDEIRSKFETPDKLLVATTGSWNRTGGLGTTPANAWTAMPGSAPYGIVLEQPVGGYANLVAHELGHYLNLDHVSDKADLMNAVIYDSSVTLTQDQCTTARTTATGVWSSMLRRS